VSAPRNAQKLTNAEAFGKAFAAAVKATPAGLRLSGIATKDEGSNNTNKYVATYDGHMQPSKDVGISVDLATGKSPNLNGNHAATKGDGYFKAAFQKVSKEIEAKHQGMRLDTVTVVDEGSNGSHTYEATLVGRMMNDVTLQVRVDHRTNKATISEPPGSTSGGWRPASR